jgi:zinc transport system permease protein
MTELLTYGFMQRALVVGLLIGMTCSLLGVFLILRKNAMIGHGLAHVTFGGVALGLFLQVLPLLVALAVGILSALAILRLKERAGLYGDTAIGIFSSAGMALGVLLASLAGSFNVALFGYLFGNIMAIESLEVWIALILTTSVLISLVLFYQELFYLTFDPESAQIGGVRVQRLETLLAVLTAVTVVLGMKVVGILLVAALLVIPSAAGLQLAANFRQAILMSVLVGALSVLAGLVAAVSMDLPAAATIVLAATLLFFLSLGLRFQGSRPSLH